MRALTYKISTVLVCLLAAQCALAQTAKLRLDKKALVLLDASGKQVIELPMRAKQLDARPGIAIVIDSATQHVQPVRVDSARGELVRMAPLPVLNFGVESACLFRDRQGLDFVFIAAKDGQAEQWLLQVDGARLVRKLSLPIDAAQCSVDDATHTLYVKEDGVGTWAYEADSEATPRRTLLKGGRPARGAAEAAIAVVVPQVQTEPVARLGDVADDPAIWVHPADPAGSRVLGTNKKQGLMVYDMTGRQTQFLESGRLNNVDLRQQVRFDGQAFDLAVASQRDDNTVVLYGIDARGAVSELTRFATGFENIYGICLFQPRAGGLEVIVNDKGGAFRQYRVMRNAGAFSASLARSFKVASQPEGCVADDRSERLFIGEEKRGIWSLPASGSQPAHLKLVLGVGKDLHADVEGMAVYQGKRASYLVVSSQGDSSYVVLDAAAPHRVRGRFKVGFNAAAGIDGTAETDGLDVTSRNLGGPFNRGMLVIQDGYKRMPDGPQNFKYVGWEDLARALQLPLEE
ncbi:phytase [Massilia sp. CF038]|uniref:phytase n=1 Tax=Massilia sp. CF038 TaxID=1881045 RepID=UPI000912480A|nr:phytase [Massilia sp. CF038]SHH13241.1 3-phytase (myo-inositol-hexaphosphate 3-phosphohydrolase) [Massilia sp. CF038]